MNKYIIDEYKDYKSKEIQSGYRCKTYLLENDGNKVIYQIYLGDTKYQARKKEYITNIIKREIDIEEIPNIIAVEEYEEFAYLVTEYKQGEEFKNFLNKEFDYKNFYKSLSNILSKVHSVHITDEKFGWVHGDKILEKKFFYEYIEDEIERNLKRIDRIITNKKCLDELKTKCNDALCKIRSIQNIKPVISWYDINENNILVDKEMNITALLDAGGARIAAKEWDIAFIKMDLCRCEDEYSFFKSEYSKKAKIDDELLDALTIIVELDDIAFQLETNTKLPISFASNFNEVISEIQKMIN